MMDFESAIKSQSYPIAVDFDSRRRVLLLAFGGLQGQLGFPMFEFNNLTSGLTNINKIYLRDGRQQWYHRGLPNIGDNVDDIASFLRPYTTHQSTKRIINFGVSGVGYAALLLGHILQVDEVHAFSPKTFIDPVKRLLVRDTMFWKQMMVLLLSGKGQKKYFDLKIILLASINSKRNFHIYYGVDHELDRLHATRIGSIPGIHLHPYPYEKHNLVRILKDSGELRQIIDRVIQ